MSPSPSGVPKASPAHIGAGTKPRPGGDFPAPYDPSDPAFDSQRIKALSAVLQRLANAGPAMEGEGPWAHLSVFRRSGQFAVELVMPQRAGMATYYSTSALMDPAWDGIEARYYDDLETAVRAMLDDVCVRLWGHRPRAFQPVQRSEPRAFSSASAGGDDRF